MFTNVRFFIKTSFAFFFIGILSGLYLYASRFIDLPVPFTLRAAHTHILLLGGMVMMILGVAIWFFPRPTKDDKKYKPEVIGFFYIVFTSVTLGRFGFEILEGFMVDKIYGLIAFVCSIVQVISIVILVYSIWGRIRPLGSQIREKNGERF